MVLLLGIGFWAFIILLVVAGIIIFAVMLVKASKKETSEGTMEIDSKIRNSLSKARQQKFKAENRVLRLNEWTNDIIQTTYSELFPDGMPYGKSELGEKYEELKKEHGEKLSYEQMDKCDSIVTGYKNQIEAEKVKIEAFEQIQKQYETLKEKMRIAKQRQRKNEKIDKHTERLKEVQADTSADASKFEHQYTLEDLEKEVALKEEYVNQLEQLTYQYGDDIEPTKSIDYKNDVDNIMNKIGG